jgi:hypothetical protein
MLATFCDLFQKLITVLTNNDYQNLFSLIAIIVSSITLIVAIFIPRRILLNQQFASLTEQYRSTEMGYAIFSIFNFYEKDCRNNPDNIREEYIKRFRREIKIPKIKKKDINPSNTLQFQRRLVAHFYWDLARLYFESRFPRLERKKLYQMVGLNERRLINLVLQMSEANVECFAKYENTDETPNDDVPMNQFLKRLYDETKGLK